MQQPIPNFCDLAAPGVQVLQPYQPGKPIAELEREYGVRDIVKLASNENPLGPSLRGMAAAQRTLAELHRYPDGNGFELKAALARHHNIDPAWITLGSGSNDCLDMVARAFLCPGREGLFAEHAFAVYPIATLSAGAIPVAAPAQPAASPMPYGHDLAAMAERIGPQTAVVFIANPNNPTGTWLERAQLEAFLARVPPHVIVVLDEAYVEFAVDAPGYPDGTQWLAQMRNLVVTRTFSKAYGLAGLRVGYSLSHPQVAELLNRVRHPFNVNSVAQAAAAAALADTAHLHASVELNRTELARLVQGCVQLELAVLPSAGNFLCVEVGGRAAEVYEGLLRRGVIVRPVAGYNLPRHLRVSVGRAHENERFLAGLQGLAAEGLLERTGSRA
jgi:histidinol-phosphate aminotransferase